MEDVRRHMSRLVVALLLATSGCGKTLPTLDELRIACADLQGAKSSPLGELREEIAALEEAGETPLTFNRPLPAMEVNAAAALADTFDPQLLDLVLKRVQELFPDQQFVFTAAELEQLRLYVQQHAEELAQLHEGASRPECNFDVHFEHGFVGLEEGYLDATIAAVGLLSFETELIARDDGAAAAVSNLQDMFRWVEMLAETRTLHARTTAANLRSDSLVVLERVANDASATPAVREELFALLEAQLSRWPADDQPLRGYRVQVLHAYEGIRRGLSPLTPDDETRYRAEGIYPEVLDLLKEGVDADQLFFLRQMKVVLEKASRPHFERREAFVTLMNQLQDRKKGDDYPRAAAELFLPDVFSSLGDMASDRAVCEAWHHALGLACDKPVDEARLNPLNGRPYAVRRSAERIIVDHTVPGVPPATLLVRNPSQQESKPAGLE